MPRRIRIYGGGGKPEPGDGRCVSVSWTCEACGEHIGPDDSYCKHCGGPFTGDIDDSELETLHGNAYKTAEEVPESWLDRCTDNGYARYTDADGNRRYVDNGQLVSDMPFRPCARCGHYPNSNGDDWCIQGLGKVVNACCGHGTHKGYLMFDDGRIIEGWFEVGRES